MISDQEKHSQKIGSRLKSKRGTDFFASINSHSKLSEAQVKHMLDDFKNRKERHLTVPLIAKKYGCSIPNVYYHARLNQ